MATDVHLHTCLCLRKCVWGAFRNHPCAREHSIYMHAQLTVSSSGSVCVCVLRFLSPVPPPAFTPRAVGAHAYTHTEAHTCKQTDQTNAPSHSRAGGWRSLLKAQLSRTHTHTSKTLLVLPGGHITHTENEASGLLSGLWMTVLIIWDSSGRVCVCVCAKNEEKVS